METIYRIIQCIVYNSVLHKILYSHLEFYDLKVFCGTKIRY